jgi:hypothetical protein
VIAHPVGNIIHNVIVELTLFKEQMLGFADQNQVFVLGADQAE